jgi:hypothetical protein
LKSPYRLTCYHTFQVYCKPYKMGNRDLDLQVGALMHYLEHTFAKGCPIDLNVCARDIALEPIKYGTEPPSMQCAWGFILMCLRWRFDYTTAKEIELARDSTKEILRLIEWPMEQMCEGSTFDEILDSYDKMLHPERYPPPEPDPMQVCWDALDQVRPELAKHTGFSAACIVYSTNGWGVRIECDGAPTNEFRSMIQDLFPKDMQIYFTDLSTCAKIVEISNTLPKVVDE